MEWINLTQDRGKWRTVVNAVMNFHSILSVLSDIKSQINMCYTSNNNLLNSFLNLNNLNNIYITINYTRGNTVLTTHVAIQC
jgi:hypothetical protein